MRVNVEGGTNAGWRKILMTSQRDWKCPRCRKFIRYFWARCPNCDHVRP